MVKVGRIALSWSTKALEKSPIGDLAIIERGPYSGHLAYLPHPLPRELDLSKDLICLLTEATLAVGTLVGVGETLPNPALLVSPLMHREAVLSSRIEGTQASLSDLFMYEASGRVRGDVVEVSNYIGALMAGLDLVKTLPVCLRLMNQVHAVLLKNGVRGANRRPGEIRTEQVWIGQDGTGIGEARFIPPPADRVMDLLGDWEQYANAADLKLPPLIQCALLHYQFESIHPYWDGNGRVGRLLVILFLCAKGILPTPLLYLSPYFEKDRHAYYDHLYDLSVTGNWEAWLEYFLEGVRSQARETLETARRVRNLHGHYQALLRESNGTANDFRLVDHLFTNPVVSAPGLVALLGVSRAGARGIIDRLMSMGILEELPGMHWPKIFMATDLFAAIHGDSDS